MSFISKVSLEQARAAKNSLKQKFAKDFANASEPLVNGTGIGRISTSEYCVQVNLQRVPTADEKKNLPDTHLNVKVQYQVTGPICAL